MKKYGGNFKSIVGPKPNEVKVDLVLKDYDRIMKWSKNLSDGRLYIRMPKKSETRYIPAGGFERSII